VEESFPGSFVANGSRKVVSSESRIRDVRVMENKDQMKMRKEKFFRTKGSCNIHLEVSGRSGGKEKAQRVFCGSPGVAVLGHSKSISMELVRRMSREGMVIKRQMLILRARIRFISGTIYFW
jgi:hypothetical protein